MTDDKENAEARNRLSGFDRPAFDSCMRTEQERILRGSQFHSSPTLARLLQWLVSETLAGRGDLIKSYTIAVEGLGRPEEFDSQADSYPRVQIGRLRKALQIHYAQQGPADGQCLYLQSGSYRIRLGRLEHAYPQLYRPLSRETMRPHAFEEPVPAGPPLSLPSSGMVPRFRPAPRHIFWTTMILLTMLLIAISFGYFARFNDKERVFAHRSHSPVVILAPVEGGNTSQSAAIANDAYAVMADGLSRSWVAQIRMGAGGDSSSSGWSPANYRLETQIGETSEGSKVFFARLSDNSSSTVVWSTMQPIDSSKSMMENIGPVIAQLAGPYGAIARNEAKLLKDISGPGYPCLLQYLSFLESHDPILGSKVSRCLQQPSPEPSLQPVRLAFLAFYSMDSDREVSNRSPILLQALEYSRQAEEADPKEAYAQFALARIHFINNDCGAGRRHASLAVSANPYDPIILAVLGNFNSLCGYEEGFDMLDKAYQYRVGGESYARLSLILAAIRSGDLDRLPSLKDGAANQDGVGLAYHYLCETLIAAALGDATAARRGWKQFVAASPQPKSSTDVMLRQVILADAVRAKVVAFLTAKGVIVDP